LEGRDCDLIGELHPAWKDCRSYFRMTSAPVRFRKEDIPNGSLERYRYISKFDAVIIFSYTIDTVTCLLNTRTTQPEVTAVATKWRCKHISTETKPRDRRNRYTRNNRRTVGGGVLCWVLAEVILGDVIGCHIR
jgi:hypothetical protein